MSQMVSHAAESGDGHKKDPPPTRTGSEGSAKRNIARRHNGASVKEKAPRRGGGGGKGMWDPTDDGSLAVSTEAVADKRDPNYDSSEDANYVLVSDSGMIDSSDDVNNSPALTLPEFKKRLSAILEEYFLSEDVEEVLRSVMELDCPSYNYEVVKRGINMSLDAKDHERELVSRLVSEAYPDVLSSMDIGRGFQRLFEMIDDIQLDAPNAKPLVAAFLARAVVDETLPPSFLQAPHNKSLGGEIVDGAMRLLSRDHAISRLERVWGPGDGRPVEEVKVAIDQLVMEYLLSRQLDEAGTCVKELNCPFFHHEVVKRAVKAAIDKSDDDRTAMSSLLAYLHANEIVSEHQVILGFNRLYELLPDIVLDCPAAPSILDKFVQQAKADGCLPKDYEKPSEPQAKDTKEPTATTEAETV